MFEKLALVCVLLSGTIAAAESRPNIVWIISDDLGPELGCYGYTGVATPHLDRIRSARTGRFKYIRNFHPDRPYLQHSGYKKLQYPVLTVMRVLHAEGRWSSPFLSTTRPKEELYDLRADPHELKNLADSPGFAQHLARLRGAVEEWIETTGDQGAVDEGKIAGALSSTGLRARCTSRRAADLIAGPPGGRDVPPVDRPARIDDLE